MRHMTDGHDQQKASDALEKLKEIQAEANKAGKAGK